MRIVLDTASLISALRSKSGAAAEVLQLILEERIVILLDYKLVCEYRDVALRPEHVAAAKRSADYIARVIDDLEVLAEPVSIRSQVRPLSPDPDDDMVLDVAINGLAEALITQNAKHFVAPARRFQIPVWTPAELLTQMRRGEDDGN